MENDNSLQVIVEKTHPRAIIPTKGTPEAACFDVYSVEEKWVRMGCITIIDLGFKVKIPKGYEIVVRPRSGLAFKHGVTMANSPGTIDSDYRGPMKIALTKTSGSLNCLDGWAKDVNPFQIKVGDRIAQLKLQKVPEFIFVEGEVDEKETKRGAGGFGSTGN